jgi:hypothetical protein
MTTPADTRISDERLAEIEAGLEGVTDAYRITADGRVFSIASDWRGLGEREMRQALNASGYPSVRLTVAGRRRHWAVHRLVAHVFLPPRPSPEHEVRHIDGDKRNNSDNNLAWGTRSENALDRQRHGTERAPENAAKTIDRRKGELCATSKLSNAEAQAIRARFRLGESVPYIARDYPSVTYDTVNNAARGKTFKDI